jgi:biopolymer transport protein ExbD
MVFIAYQNITIDGVQTEQASFVADTRETFQPPMYGLRSDYEDLFAYEAALAELTSQKEAAETEEEREAIEARIATLVKPDNVLPFVLLDRIVEHEGRAELVGGKVLFDTDIDVSRGAETIAEAKADRAAAVAAITVEVDGMVFDGDETAQERMARTVTAATATGASMDDTTVWVLHDNTVAQPTIRQLATALRMAGEAQTALWTKPYEA